MCMHMCMHMCYVGLRMKSRRVQILMEEPHYERIEREAARRGVSVAEVIRDAVDQALPDPSDRRAALWREIQAAPRMPVPDPGDLRRELDELRGARW